jgi:hypothetical protein
MDNWTSHIPVLLEILARMPNSKFLELGTGYGSTSAIINSSEYSVHLETNSDWYNKMKPMEIENHKIELFTNFTLYEWNCPYFEENWDICFIDNAPGESRQSNLIKLKDKCKIIICHDTEELIHKRPNYRWDFSNLKHCFTYTKHPVTTTICSNHDEMSVEYFQSLIKNLL